MDVVSEAKLPDLTSIAAEMATLRAESARIHASLQKVAQLMERHLEAGEQMVPVRALHAILRDAQQGQQIGQAPRVEPVMVALNHFPNRYEDERIRAETRLGVRDQQIGEMSRLSRWWRAPEINTEHRHLVSEVKHARELAVLAREVGEQLRPLSQSPTMQRFNAVQYHFQAEVVRAKERLNLHDRHVHQMSGVSRWWHGRELSMERQHLLDNLVRSRHAAEMTHQFVSEVRPLISRQEGREQKVSNGLKQGQAVKQEQTQKQGVKEGVKQTEKQEPEQAVKAAQQQQTVKRGMKM